MPHKITRISKSQYLKGIQCPKSLWFYRHRPDLAPEIPETKQQLFDTGHEVGKLAQQYFEGGVEITGEYYEIDKAIAATQFYIKDGKEIIYEATACSDDGGYSRIDILRKTESGKWDLIEVKQSTDLKDYHIEDIAFQRYAFERAGYNIEKSFLMHLNNGYVRFGDLDLKELFILKDCSDVIAGKQAEISDNLKNLLAVLNSANEPVAQIGDQCSNPFECDYCHHCWQHIPEYSVYNVFKKDRLQSLLEQGIIDIKDVPADFDAPGRKVIDVSAFKNNLVYVDKTEIKLFLNSLVYPLYYLDYETIFPAIPLFDNSSPYQQIPFQFSLHLQEKPGGELKHVEFLHTESTDPRPGFVKALIASCGKDGSVIVYNQAFEARINNELSTAFPAYQNELAAINARMIDLLKPFRSRSLYHPEMKGSASLKSVLPAFVPEMNYDDMEIGDGGTASMLYLSCVKDLISPEEKEVVYQNLRDYCGMDTMAEVRLLDVLYKLTS